MVIAALQPARRPGGWLADLAANDGSRNHGWLRHLHGNEAATMRDVADVVHHLALVHGARPSVAELALRGEADRETARWMGAAALAFEAERALIAALVVAAGPLPSTPGQAATTAALAGQRHALAMLVGSNRAGTALGTVLALSLDWRALRPVLLAASERFGVAPPPCRLPSEDDVADMAERQAGTASLQRALAFGAQQFLLQQRGMWDLLEARAIARTTAG